MATFTVDRAAVEAEVARRRRILEHSYRRWLLTRLAVSLVAFYALALLIRVAVTRGPLTLSTKGALAFFGFPALAAILMIWLASRTLFRGDALDADKLAHEVEREVARLTGPDWPIKTLLAGVSLGAVAGIPVAVALWVTRSPIARSGMLAGIVIFAAGMLLWAILMAFAIRSATLYLYRGMITRG